MASKATIYGTACISRFCLLLFMAVAIGAPFFGTAPEARSAEMSFAVTSKVQTAMQYAFYSQGRSKVWPNSHQSYNSAGPGNQKVTLTCQKGEVVCFGGWELDNAAVRWWGVGYQDAHSCSNCCFKCGPKPANKIVID